MSAFEVIVTPNRLKNKKRIEAREPTEVVMAPFSAKAIVQFEDVPVTKSARRVLRIINPTAEDIEVKVSKGITPEQNVTLSWTEGTVAAMDETEMEILWNPQMEIACKETLQLTDNRNFRKDVMVILKSKSNKPTKNVRRFPTISSSTTSTHVKTLRLKSPTGATKSSSKFNAQLQQKKRLQKQQHLVVTGSSSSSSSSSSSKVTKSQWNDCSRGKAAVASTSTIATTSSISPLSERNREPATDSDQSLLISPLSVNNKENISPTTPGNVLSLIDKLKFTPATDTKQNFCAKIDNLAAWPTPVTAAYAEIPHDAQQICRRRLTAVELAASDDVARAIPTITVNMEPLGAGEQEYENAGVLVITNKTFEVKRQEILDLSKDMLDESDCLGEGRLSCDVVTPVNKTTTLLSTPVGRPLEMIQEEEASFEADQRGGKLQKTYTAASCESPQTDLKRDIKLVGTPLRKYSESMKDLSLKSPQSKLAIQGSLPNLNEMESIRSIENNRYFQQSALGRASMSVIHEQSAHVPVNSTKPVLNDSTDTLNSSEMSVTSHADLLFNQSEILAQSSRFNLNEVGLKSRKNSPVATARTKAGGKQSQPASNAKSKPVVGAAGHKRSLHELSFSDSPSNESLVSTHKSRTGSAASAATTSRTASGTVSPPKRLRVDANSSFQRPTPVNASAGRPKNAFPVQARKFKLAKTLSLLKKPITPRKLKGSPPRVKLYDCELYLQPYINPDPFAATTTCDPFLASTMYLDERAVDRHQGDFKKWLNALVTIPAELDTDCTSKVDVGKLFNEVRHKDLILAPTKEEQSMNYLTKFRLESLRRAAVQLFLSEEMRVPCSKVAVYVNKNALRIRADRNLHLDVVMQRYILELLLCFNPLWLRLGLEVVYGEKIHLHSNRDIVGLSTFILNRLFRDKFLEQKYSKAYTLSEEYAEHIKKFTLQKMLFLFLFLDKAKSQRIVKHNPCLFVKQSPHKETKEVLLKFSSELLANVGDITRELKRLGYVLQHKQAFLDEFDYAFGNLAVDLRDGIRLTRVMEVILLRDDLSKQLRVPAISRLQRIFNVNLALRSLSEADFELKGDITAADVVDGHREKTLSLLWQIIYKFRSPKFHAAARVLQKWWRNSWLRVVIRRRLALKEQMRRSAAATCIQSAYRSYITRRFVKVYREERTQAAFVVQKWVRRWLAQRRFRRAIASVRHIQLWYRAQRQGGSVRREFLQIRAAAVKLQQWWRRQLLARKLLQIAAEVRLQRAQRRQAAVSCIQTRWRSYCVAQKVRRNFLQLRAAAIIIQRTFRANCAMKKEREHYQRMRTAAITVQRRMRATLLMKSRRWEFRQLRKCTIAMQRRRQATLAMRSARDQYLRVQNATTLVQRRWKAILSMRKERAAYLALRRSACTLQCRYRARLAMRRQLSVYQEVRRRVILIQRKWRATRLARSTRVQFYRLQYHAMVVQQTFRATRQMRLERAAFLQLKAAVICIQRRYRATLVMRIVRTETKRKRRAIVTIQQRFRAYKNMRLCRAKYRGLQEAVLCIQQHARGFLQMKRDRARFLQLRQAALVLQKAFRARLAMQKQLQQYQQLKAATVRMQQRYRALLAMRVQRQQYARQRQLIVQLQMRFRAKLLARQVRREYTYTLVVIVRLQQRVRATLQMRATRRQYLEERAKIVIIQRYFRTQQLMRSVRGAYERQRSAAICIQHWYRAVRIMHVDKGRYQRVRSGSISIQRRWRAVLAGREQRQLYVKTVRNIVLIQRALRATLQMRADRQEYQRQQQAAAVLQRHYRARREMLQIRSQYQLIRSLIVCIQRKFRAHRAMLVQRHDYQLLRRTTIHLQQKFRGREMAVEQREHFLSLCRSVVSFQAHVRGLLARRRLQALMTPEMIEYLRRKKAAKAIQRFWRGYRIRKRFNNVRLLQIRKNIELLKATKTAVNTIRYKMQDAIRILRGRHGASDALQVLMCLDRISRTVPHLLMAQSDFISTFCYDIMAQTIRSEADKHLLRYCSRIILNLARYTSTTENSFRVGGLVTIAQILLRWCDKDCEIFNTLCTLIWVFSHCQQRQQVIRNFMTTPEAIYVVRETKKLVARKEKMKQNVRKPAIAHTPRAATSRPLKNFSSRALPSLEPDYGVIHNKPYTFISSVYAFDTILCKLGIDII